MVEDLLPALQYTSGTLDTLLAKVGKLWRGEFDYAPLQADKKEIEIRGNKGYEDTQFEIWGWTSETPPGGREWTYVATVRQEWTLKEIDG